MKKISNLFKKYQEMIMYLIFGVLTTVVSLVTYFVLTNTFLNPDEAIMLQVANIVAWIISVLFAYITNRKYVFNSHDRILKEFLKFTISRVFSLVVDMLMMFVFVSVLKYNDGVIKLISQVVIIILNYVFSKVFVFKKEK